VAPQYARRHHLSKCARAVVARLTLEGNKEPRYIWEVYKPAHQRRWGYYTLPILWHDRFVARIDPKLDGKTGTLAINGFWLDGPSLGDDPAFLAAVERGLARFASYLEASRVVVGAPDLPTAVSAVVSSVDARPQP
jgi:uncharacterized protein YcaQ